MTETLETPASKIVPRLKTKYADSIKSTLLEEFKYENVNQVPRLVKVVVNMGVGDAAKDSKLIDGAVRDLRRNTWAEAWDPSRGMLRAERHSPGTRM